MSTTEQTNIRGTAILSDSLSAEGPWTVHGVAIGPDETTIGMSGQKKFWPGDALQEAADTLAGKSIVKNHVNNDVDAVVGAVTEARYHPEYGVIYEGEIDEEGLAQKVARNRLDVSPRIIHNHVDELEENEDGALVVDEVREFVNLALVPQGAAESNEIEIGDSGMLSISRADLRQALDYEVEAPEPEPEPDETDADVEQEQDQEVDEADADDLGADEDLDDDIEAPVSSEESAPASEPDEASPAAATAGETDADRDAAEDDHEHAAASLSADDDADGDGADETSVLSELTFLGADSEETTADAEIDLRDIDILR